MATTALTAVVLAGRARAAVFTTPERALAEAFPGTRLEARRFALTDSQLAAVRSRARVRTSDRAVTAHLAWSGDTLRGTAFFDTRTVRTMPGTFMITLGPDSTVRSVEVIAFHEPSDYLPTARFRQQFPGHRLDDGLWPRRDIRTLTGATLSTQAVTESVRLALAWYELLVAPWLAGSPKPGVPSTPTPEKPR